MLAGLVLFAGPARAAWVDLTPEADEPLGELPGEFAGAEVTGAYEPMEWWKAFADPVLDRIIEAALDSNFDLAEAVARVEQARARERIVKAPAFPLLRPSADVTDTDVPTNAGIAAQLDEVGLGPDVYGDFGIELPNRLDLTTYTLGVDFSYELDFWGRNRNDALAAGAERLAREADYLTARMGVLAETVRTYLEIVDLRHQRKLAGESVEILTQRASLAGFRYERGLGDALSLYTARQNRRNAEAELPQIEALLADAEWRLWVLVGGYRADLANILPDTLTSSALRDPVPAGIPAGLLAQRPDVRAARQRMEATRYTVGARRADLLPSLSLYGSIGLQSVEGGEWFDPDQWFRNLSFNLLGPVFQGSRLRSNVDLAEARLDEAAAAYGRSVVTAVNEVEAALANLDASRRRHSLLASAQQAAQAETALQEQRYISGVGDYETFLTTTQSLMGARSALAAAERDLGYARLALHRALGGAWAGDEKEPVRTAASGAAPEGTGQGQGNPSARDRAPPSPPGHRTEWNEAPVAQARTPVSTMVLDGQALRDEQVVTPADLSLVAPGLNLSATYLGWHALSARGIGQLTIHGEPGVATWLNGIPLPLNLNTMELFDMERVEVLKGPSNTLYGRNATGGAINFTTRQPAPDEKSVSFGAEIGDYLHRRVGGTANYGGAKAALRIAGYKLDRDGFTDNLAAGQVNADGATLPVIDDDLDGRDAWAARASFTWHPTDNSRVWMMVNRFEESDDRTRTTNFGCDTNPYPTYACAPDGRGNTLPHVGATLAGMFAGGLGALPLGPDGAGPDQNDFFRPPLDDLRDTHTDFEAVYEEEETLVTFGADYSTTYFDLSIAAGLLDGEFLSRQDYFDEVGQPLPATPLNPLGVWPVSEPAGKTGDEWGPPGCDVSAGRGGILGGCILQGYDQTRVIDYDQAGQRIESRALDARVRTKFEGRANFRLGFTFLRTTLADDYYVLGNLADATTFYGSPGFGFPQVYPGYFVDSRSPGTGERTDSGSIFGEGYFELDDKTRLTLGLRFSQDDIIRDEALAYLGANNHAGIIFGAIHPLLRAGAAEALGIDPAQVPLELALQGAFAFGVLDPGYLSNLGLSGPESAFWSRTPNLLLGPLSQGAPPEVDLALYHGVPQDQINAALATPAYSQARVAISNQVPIVAGFGESRALNGLPDEADFRNLSGSAAVEYRLNDNMSLDLSYSRGYKPGDLNIILPRRFQSPAYNAVVESEKVNALELGLRSSFMDNRLQFNASPFLYDYQALQAFDIRHNAAVVHSLDADVYGVDLNLSYRFRSVPALRLDLAYNHVNSSLDDARLYDHTNTTGDESGWVLLKNIVPQTASGSIISDTFIAREAQISQAVVDGALATNGAYDLRNGITTVSVSYPANAYGVSIPTYFSRQYLDDAGVETRFANPVSVGGNMLPNTPEHSGRLSMTYLHPVHFLGGGWLAAFRWDYYMQSAAYSRIFNTPGDRMDSWGRHNLSLELANNKGISLKLWVRNLTNENNLTGHHLATDGSGSFRYYFAQEPRIFGMSMNYRFDYQAP